MYVGKWAGTIFAGRSSLCGCDPPEVQALFTYMQYLKKLAHISGETNVGDSDNNDSLYNKNLTV
jgi:cytochrome c